jgi:hypothetical protein
MNTNSISLGKLLSAFGSLPEAESQGIELNAQQDIRYAHDIDVFSKVVHIFSMEWKGIRSAVGAMSGTKLAVTADRSLRSSEMTLAINIIAKFEKAIFHGVSANARNLMEYFRRNGGPECYVVWHGNHAQLSLDSERSLFLAAKRLHEKGFIKRMHILREGCHLLLNTWPNVLFNIPPNIKMKKNRPGLSENGTALVPVTAEIRKNLYTNIIAAVASPKIKSILTYNGNDLLEFCGGKSIKFLRYDGIEGHLKVLMGCVVSLNVTCVDCQPMVDLEALAAGTPAITGSLFLEKYFKSEYPKIITVQNPLSVEDIVKTIDRLDAIPGEELSSMMAEYKDELLQKHIESYKNFLA